MIVVCPSLEGFNIYSIVALVAVVFITLREIITRKLPWEVPTITIVLSTTVGSAIFSRLMMRATDWIALRSMTWLLLIGAAFAVSIVNVLNVLAMRTGEIGFVLPFMYTSMIGATGLRILMFGDWPDLPTLIETLLIVSTGIYTFR